jgi:exopolyphosphatase/pppGpp-phosphohydrolase
MKAVLDLGTNTFNLLIGDIKQKEKGILVSLEEPVMQRS